MPEGGFGPEDRRSLDTLAGDLFRQAVENGGLNVDDPRLLESSEATAARDLLVDIGLLDKDEEHGRLVPLDPSSVQAQIVVPLGQRGADLLNESALWAESLSSLARVYRQSAQRQQRPTIELRGPERINKFILAALADCRKELLTAQPHGRRPEKVLK